MQRDPPQYYYYPDDGMQQYGRYRGRGRGGRGQGGRGGRGMIFQGGRGGGGGNGFRGGWNGGGGGNRMNYGPPHGRDLPTYVDERPQQQTAPPLRPLTRVMARVRTQSGSKQSNGEQIQEQNPITQDAYRMEVNEYIGKANGDIPANAIPCVTVRDLHTFLPDNQQKRIWIPVAICGELVKALKESIVENKNNATTYDVNKLPLQFFECPVTRKKAEIIREGESTRLRTYMNCPSKENYKPGDNIEIIELRNQLMGRLIKFFEDVATRYRPMKNVSIPSLYSYSGERNFLYNVRETRWGLRLHISQVSDLSRNVIAIPLEVLAPFRDRLNQVLELLELEKKVDNHNGSKSKATKSRGSGKRGRNGRGRGGRHENGNDKNNEKSNTSQEDNQSTVLPSTETTTITTKEEPTIVNTNSV